MPYQLAGSDYFLPVVHPWNSGVCGRARGERRIFTDDFRFRAALFGLITYATYDLTNLATIKDWPLLITIVDMIWGTVLSLMVSLASFFIARWLM